MIDFLHIVFAPQMFDIEIIIMDYHITKEEVKCLTSGPFVMEVTLRLSSWKQIYHQDLLLLNL